MKTITKIFKSIFGENVRTVIKTKSILDQSRLKEK